MTHASSSTLAAVNAITGVATAGVTTSGVATAGVATARVATSGVVIERLLVNSYHILGTLSKQSIEIIDELLLRLRVLGVSESLP